MNFFQHNNGFRGMVLLSKNWQQHITNQRHCQL